MQDTKDLYNIFVVGDRYRRRINNRPITRLKADRIERGLVRKLKGNYFVVVEGVGIAGSVKGIKNTI